MIKSNVVSKYAKVLFSLDMKKQMIEKRQKEFEFLLELFKKIPNLFSFLQSPQIDFAEKKELLNTIFPQNSSESFVRLLQNLMKKGHLNYLEPISEQYRLLLDNFLNIWEAKILTAVPIDAEIEEKLRTKLEEAFQKKIMIKKKVDPKIIGGALLAVNNQVIDWSLSSRLQKLKENLMADYDV